MDKIKKIDKISMLRNNPYELMKIITEIHSMKKSLPNDYEFGESVREYLDFLNGDGDEIYNKWKSLGFLDGLPIKSQINLAHAYESVAIKLIADNEKGIRKYNDEVDSIVFPILREIIIINPRNELNDEFVNGVLEKTLELIKSSVYDGIDDLHADPHIDVKAELLKLFVETNYGK